MLAPAPGVRSPFDVATDADEPEIRRVLRENAMGGAIRLSFEREPDARLAAKIDGPLLHQTIVARREGGRLFGIGTRSVRIAFINGQPMPVGYLGSLRLDHDHRARPRMMAAGYAKLREVHDADRAASIYLTSILSDNLPARRLLEANLPGMPTYRFVSEFVTFIFRPKRTKHAHIRTTKDHATAAELLARRSEQFAPAWSESALNELRTFGLPPSAFRIAYRGDTPIACAAAWDTTSFKQTVVREYSRGLQFFRPVVNALSRFTNAPRLPKLGEAMRFSFLSHVVTPPDQPELIVPLVRSMNVPHVLIAGFAPNDPRLAALRRAFRGREIRSRLYVVHWPDGSALAESLDDRICFPEVALL